MVAACKRLSIDLIAGSVLCLKMATGENGSAQRLRLGEDSPPRPACATIFAMQAKPLLVLLSVCSFAHAAPKSSQLKVVSQNPLAGKTLLQVDAVQTQSKKPLPMRVIVTASDGSHPDGSGRGAYHDGRFFVDGTFTVTLPPGKTKIEIRSGPHHIPIVQSVDLKPNTRTVCRANLSAWFSPAKFGWHGGDNHVHAQHDAHAKIKTDLAYTALQGRANGLGFITEAGSSVSYDGLARLSTDAFLIRYAGEIRPGPFVGHLNTPGMREKIPDDVFKKCLQRPLPGQAVYQEIRKRGGVVIHTHPMTPNTQLHWMGAGGVYSDAVTRNPTDLFDVDAAHSQKLYFAALNLGNTLGVSSYTDAALGRAKTLSPGDRRVYVHSKKFDYRSIVEAMRAGRTMATNGGPVFAFVELGDKGPGDRLKRADAEGQTITLQTRSLNTLRTAELYFNGARLAAFNVKDKSGHQSLTQKLAMGEAKAGWLVGRAEDIHGKWCLTSPIYIDPDDGQNPAHGPAHAIVFEIANHSRFATLRKDFFAHAIVTTRQTIQKAELIQDGKTFQTYDAGKDHIANPAQWPVTGMPGTYEDGVSWDQKNHHVQFDRKITESGWYGLRLTLKNPNGQTTTIVSDQLKFDAANKMSHALSLAHLRGHQTEFTLWGYGEDIPLDQVKEPYTRGGWWYPGNKYWKLVTQFGAEDKPRLVGWPKDQPVMRFRAAK